MLRPRALVAWFVLGWLVFCPLASAGFFACCHEDEAALDCCLPLEKPAPGTGEPGSGHARKAPLAAVVVQPAVAAAGVRWEISSTAEWPLAPPPQAGARRCALLSVFLI